MQKEETVKQPENRDPSKTPFISGSILNLYKNRVAEAVQGQSILITGGTGSFGQKFIDILFSNFKPKAVIVFSRDEFKQHHMRTVLGYSKYPNLYFVIGDVRNRQRIYETLREYKITIVIHAAAIKHVDFCEKNPTECIETNITGAINLVNACKDAGVKKVLALSTDKCVDPVNIYGASKLCLERVVISGNNFYAMKEGEENERDFPIFSVLRYGNVLGSRGSVIHVFSDQIKNGEIKVTNGEMTRFTIMKEEAVNFAMNCLSFMIGGEIFVPELPTYNIGQLVNVMKPHKDFPVKIVGVRAGEKIHECMISRHESHLAFHINTNREYSNNNHGTFYVIRPHYCSNYVSYYDHYSDTFGDCVADCASNFEYTSNNTLNVLEDRRLRTLVSVTFCEM